MDQAQKDRYVRWQHYRISQLSFSINLFLGFSVASLAYAISLKLGKDCYQVLPMDLIIILWSVSAALGSVATVSRLLDYRYTAKKIKEGGDANAFMARLLGRVTWCSFWGQVLIYVAGGYFFIQGVISS